MRKNPLFLLFLLLISGCSQSENNPSFNTESYGVFLGANSTSLKRISKYEKVFIDVDEFSVPDIEYLHKNNTEVYAYLSIGSLETYRSYYEDYKDLCFYDYENWPDEKWVDVSDDSWQEHISIEADRFLTLGVDGIFMDNFDVYYVAMEEYECSNEFKEAIYQGSLSIFNNLSSKPLKLVINSGTDFLERINEEQPSLLNNISCYTQECVFSSIEDYDNDVFGIQDKETQDYYFGIISMMKTHSNILLLEYTVDKKLIDGIKTYCQKENFYYYVSNSVNLN